MNARRGLRCRLRGWPGVFPEDVEDAAWLPYPPRGAPAPVVPRCGELPADAPTARGGMPR